MIESLQSMSLILGGSWASGINLYLSMAIMGVAHRNEWIQLPGELDVLAHPAVIGVAVILYLIEFIADKVPYVDSTWDAIHTFIRPLGGFMIGYLSSTGAEPGLQVAVAMATGAVAMDSHLTKATTRAAINASPEPVTNSVASVTEDVSVAGMFVLIMQHPVIASLLVILFIMFSVWFLSKMFKFIGRIFNRKKKTVVTSE